jgi:tetratricopeptide (TPR) repeat protein
MQGRNEMAAQLFERSQAYSSESVRLLNNLAMALSNIPGRQPDALTKIQRAMDIRLKQLGEQDPELTDTLAIVLARMGKLAEAREHFQHAILQRPDPRFQLHLADVLFQMNDVDALRALWLKINQLNMSELSLTKEESDTLGRLREQFNQKL